jgi:hypothetical protein
MVKGVSYWLKPNACFFPRIPSAGLCRAPLLFVAFVLGIVLIVWGEICGGVCLPRSQLKQNSLQTIDFRTSVAWENSAGEGVVDCSLLPITRTGEGGIRTLGSLLGYGALAKRCFRPLSHLTKSKARISQAILDFQFVICIRGRRFRRLPAISLELPIADC